jgi:hypothetical protein
MEYGRRRIHNAGSLTRTQLSHARKRLKKVLGKETRS